MSTDCQMHDTHPIRVVPNGKIYRQMFDAQVQLHRSLTGFYRKQKQLAQGREVTTSSLCSAPVVHLKADDLGHGLLSGRQKTWTEAFPNDPNVENPVLTKKTEDVVKERYKEPQSSVSSKEVRGLPDIIVPAKKGSDIIERINEGRKERHEDAVEDMHQELSVISSELEPKIMEISQMVLDHLDIDNGEIDKLLATIEKDEDLLLISEEELNKLWQTIEAHTPKRRMWIEELDKLLSGIEKKRMEMIQNVFSKYSVMFTTIAYLMQPDLQRFLDKEAQQINQTLLSNQRAYADLYVRLMSADVERERNQHTAWMRRCDDWKRGNINLAVEKFREFMKSDQIENPAGVNSVLEFMIAEQEMLNSKRIGLLESLKEMKPPASTKTATYKWNQQMLEISTELDAVNQMHMSRLHTEYENVCKQCLDHLEIIKEEMIQSGICNAETAQETVNKHMLPLVGDRQAMFEETLETMEKNIEVHNVLMNERIRAMFKFAQGASHLWDVHEIGLAKQERRLQEKLEHSRQTHDGYNQEREANLDIVMDKMRQDATEAELRDDLVTAKDMLDKIRMSYEVFHKKQTDIVKSYPVMARFELEGYDHIVCRYFNVDRHKKTRRKKIITSTSLDSETDKAATKATDETAGETTKDTTGDATPDTAQDTATDTATPDTAGDTTPDNAGGTTQDTAGDTTQDTTGDTTQDTGGDTMQDTTGDTTQDTTGDATQDTAGTITPDTSATTTQGSTHSTEKVHHRRRSSKLVGTKDSSQKAVAEGSDAEAKDPYTDDKGRHLSYTSDTDLKFSSNTLPSAVQEVLFTERGTTFYVLAEAGTDIIPTTTLFPPESEDDIPDYITSMDLPLELLLSVKEKMRINFLNHLEKWKEEALERAHSVVVAKCEELNSELDLRLHLHQPRMQRAEFDVHNVRAAELVMHSERVIRHCKGILQALFDLREEFKKMSEEHDKLSKKFKEDIEALESIFINASKSSRLIKLQHQLSDELNKFMSVIRMSLRQFRQHLDETLQMLRESNARFIKSFKVFSDGGNFCPVEIEDYRRRLEKMSHKIDENEGSIMSDLEGMESKRLDQATKVAVEFEDRFKNHMFDLIFMEKIARWFTNTQVKIKSEVAYSNTQAQKLAQHLADLVRRIDACEKPNLDKEQITAAELNETLKPIMEAFHARSVYLNCANKTKRLQSSDVESIVQGSGRVGFSHETPVLIKTSSKVIEDPSVSLIKSIIKGTKGKRFGPDSESDSESQPVQSASAIPTISGNARSQKSASRRGTLAFINPESLPNAKRTSSGQIRNRLFKIDKKFFAFGERAEEAEDRYLIGIVRRILREANEGLVSHADIYYKQKGNRAVTRPQSLPDNFEACAEMMVQKLQSYMKQTVDYHNQCLQEFRSQLIELEKSVSHIPPLMINTVLTEEIQKTEAAQKELQNNFKETLSELHARQEKYENLLRPTLGHPHQKQALDNLCQKEAERHQDFMEAIEKETKTRQDCAVKHAKTFLKKLAKMSESQLLLYDHLLVVDDVEKGKVEAKRFSTSELIRRQNAGEPLFEEENTYIIKRGKGNWRGIPSNEFVVGPKPAKVTVTPYVATNSTTLGHKATIDARDSAYMSYQIKFEDTLEAIANERKRLELEGQRQMDKWNISVEKIKQLY